MTATTQIQPDTPSRQELVQRATDLVPLLRKNAGQADRDRRVPEEDLDALEESGSGWPSAARATRATPATSACGPAARRSTAG